MVVCLNFLLALCDPRHYRRESKSFRGFKRNFVKVKSFVRGAETKSWPVSYFLVSE